MKILVVEDEQPIRDTLSELLESEGYEVETAANGVEGMSRLRANQNFNLVLLDARMPLKDGYQFRSEQMQDSNLVKIPVVLMSADIQVDKKASQARCAGYLQKPVNIDEVLSKVSECCSAI